MPILVIISLTILSACTVGRYTLENSINSSKESQQSIEKKVRINYYISIKGRQIFDTRSSCFRSKRVREYKKDYAQVTKEILLNIYEIKDAKLVSNKNNADLIIDINYHTHPSATDGEWLTGLSFGMIPSWGTRKNEVSFRLNNTSLNKIHNYWVDDNRFNHLIAFPFTWTLFFIDYPMDKYKDALGDFLRCYPLSK